MKFSQSLRQTIAEARNNPGFTALYVGGVAFAVAFTMVYAIIYYVRLAPVYPEYNRDTTMYIQSLYMRNEAKSQTFMASIGLPFVKEYLSKLSNCEYMSVAEHTNTDFVQPLDGSGDIKIASKGVDPRFFKLYEYELLAGRFFSDAEFDSGILSAVITSDLATRLYGGVEQALGKDVSVNYRNFKITGVIKPGISLFENSFAQVFYPYTAGQWYSPNSSYLGMYTVNVKLKDSKQDAAFREEIDDMLRRINAADTAGWRIDLPGVRTNTEFIFNPDSVAGEERMNLTDTLKPYLTLLLVLLIIPAINISGMIGGQMDRRMAEMGLRRSFGGSKSQLCRQVMFENLLLTLFGGFIGLIVAWIVLYACKSWILGLVSKSWSYLGNIVETEITGEMLFAPSVFIGALLICIVLNVLSAYIPVKLALRKPIVSSINVKK